VILFVNVNYKIGAFKNNYVLKRFICSCFLFDVEYYLCLFTFTLLLVTLWKSTYICSWII